MSKRWKRVLVVIAFACGVIVALAAGARALAPGWLRGAIESTAGAALGRELKIAGAFELSLSMTPSLEATDITLANAPWGSEPAMVRAGRIKIVVDLESLWARPLRIPELALEDVHVLLERDREGRANWAFATKPKSERAADARAQPLVVIEQATIRGFELVARPAPEARPLAIGIATLDARFDPATRMIEAKGAGHFGDDPWDIAGRIGPLENLYTGHELDQALTGHIGRSSLALSGRIRDPMTLGGPKIEAKVEGPDVAEVLASFGLTSPLTGAFRLDAHLAPVADGVNVDAAGAVGEHTVSVRGVVGALLRPERIDAQVQVKGPDAAVIGTWTGVRGLPARPFDVAGRVRRDGARLSFDDLKVRVGGTSLVVGGTLGDLPRCIGTDLKVDGSGSDLSELAALSRVRLPEGAFDVNGRFLIRADGLAIEDTTVHVRGSVVHATGTIGQPPECKNLAMTVDATGPDASWLSGIATIDLPIEPFEVRGGVRWDGTAVELAEVAGKLGDDSFAANGRIVAVRGAAGTDAHVRLAGSDLEKAASLFALQGLPAESFEAVGHVTITADHYAFDDVDARVGGLTARVDGALGAPSALDGTSLNLRLRGASLSDLSAWGVPAKLPPDPFAASGVLRIDRGVYHLDDASAEVGKDLVSVDGTLGALPDMKTSDVVVEASGPDLSALGRFFTAAGSEPPARMPSEAFTVTGRARRVAAGVELHGAKATVGEVKLSADGLLSTEDRGVGTALDVELSAPDTSLLSTVADVQLPAGALRAHGRVRRSAEGFQFDGTEISIGASFAQVSGRLGLPPTFAHTDLDVSVEGPDFAETVGSFADIGPLPADSFALQAHVHGSTDSFTSDRFAARLGDSDAAGRIAVRLEGKPFVDADVRSKHLNIPRLVAGFTREPEAGEAPNAAVPTKRKRAKGEHLIPDQPLGLGTLNNLDGRLRLAADEVIFPGVPLHEVEITTELKDGALRLDRFQGTGKNGGRASGSLVVQPNGESYRLHVEGRLEGGRLDVSKTGEAPELAPPLDIDYELDGTGRSLHEIAASADGRALVVLGPGRIPNNILGEGSATMISLMDALNPFRKSSPYTAMECAVAVAAIDDGKLVANPIAARTDKLTVVGNGKINFGTEAIDLSWAIKPRRNIGISAGSIANPYIKLGGTLSSPRLDVKPIEAAASTGAAVVTAGLTILFRGIYNRITAEKKVCVDALAKAEKQREGRAARKSAETGE